MFLSKTGANGLCEHKMVIFHSCISIQNQLLSLVSISLIHLSKTEKEEIYFLVISFSSMIKLARVAMYMYTGGTN